MIAGFFLRFTNSLILSVVGLLTLTGLYGLMWPWPAWMFEVHRGAAWALIALVPWKAVISYRSLKRGLDRRFDRSVTVVASSLMAALTLLVLVFGVMWAWRIGPELVWVGQYADAVISWHWMVGLGLTPLIAFHVWRRWPRPRRADFASRKAALRVIGLGAAGLAGWGIADYLARARQSAEAPRRFTGSRESGSFTGLDYPVTHTVGQGQTVLDADTWRLAVRGAVRDPLSLAYADLLRMPASDVTATLDCTSGWYTTQVWTGVPLSTVLAQAGIGPGVAAVVLKDVSGYPAFFTPGEAEEILLATHSGGQVFDHWHGFPLRAVVPSRRGWQWVKWLTEIEVIGATEAA